MDPIILKLLQDVQSVQDLAAVIAGSTKPLSVLIVAQSHANGLRLLDNLAHTFSSKLASQIGWFLSSHQGMHTENGSKIHLINVAEIDKFLKYQADIVLLDATSRVKTDIIRGLTALSLPGGRILTYYGDSLKPLDDTACIRLIDQAKPSSHSIPASNQLQTSFAGSCSIPSPSFVNDDFEELKKHFAFLYSSAVPSKDEKSEALLDIAATLIEELEKMKLRSCSKSEIAAVKKKIEGLAEFLKSIPDEQSRKQEFEGLIVIAEDLLRAICNRR